MALESLTAGIAVAAREKEMTAEVTASAAQARLSSARFDKPAGDSQESSVVGEPHWLNANKAFFLFQVSRLFSRGCNRYEPFRW